MPEQKLLSESEMEEIEAAQVERRKSLEFHQSEYPGLPSPPYINEIDALCQTVRAAWASVQVMQEAYDKGRSEWVTENAALREQSAHANTRIAELERRLRIPFGKFPCALCGGPHDFDTSVPSAVWNSVIRARNLPDYLCTTCIVREFVRAGESFTAELWGEEFNGVNIEVVVNGQNAKDVAVVQEENNSLRNRLAQVEKERGCGHCSCTCDNCAACGDEQP